MEWNPLVFAWRVTLAIIITTCCLLKCVNFSWLKVKLQKIWCTGRLQTRQGKGRGDTIAPLPVMDKIVTNKNEWRRKAEREYKLSFLGLRVLKRLAYLFSTASFAIPPSPSLTVQDTRQRPIFWLFFYWSSSPRVTSVRLPLKRCFFGLIARGLVWPCTFEASWFLILCSSRTDTQVPLSYAFCTTKITVHGRLN